MAKGEGWYRAERLKPGYISFLSFSSTVNLIVAHIDADGILSARIIYLLLGCEAEVYFPPWDDFGISEETAAEIRKRKPETLYVLDMGSDARSLETVRKLVDEDVVGKVVWLDHHPPDCDLSEFSDLESFTIVHSGGTCTAGLAYKYATIYGDQSEDAWKWIEIWTIVGIYGDAAENGELSKKILIELRGKHPWLFGEQVFGSTRYKIPQMYTTYFNTPRRIAFHHGAHLAFNACGEVERHGSLDLLKSNDPLVLAEYPYTMALQRMVELYRDIRKQVADSAIVYDYGKFAVCVVHTQYDIGGYVASIYASKLGKPVFCVNTGLPIGRTKISARAPQNSMLDVGEVLRECFGGGGHRQAASAGVDHNISREEIISALVRFVSMRGETGLANGGGLREYI